MRCAKTGLTDKDFKTILDVLNVYDPNDIIDHIPAMGTPEFMQDVQSAFKAVLAHVSRLNAETAAQYKDDDLSRTGVDTTKVPVDQSDRLRDLAYEQYIHSLS